MTVTEATMPAAPRRGFWLGVAAYVLPTFPIGYIWHLAAFAPAYHDLEIYREDILIPFGLASMLIQGVLFSWAYPRLFVDRRKVMRNGLLYGAAMGVLSWSFTTLAVGAKHVMTSVPTYVALETGFTLVQFAVVGPLIALAYRR